MEAIIREPSWKVPQEVKEFKQKRLDELGKEIEAINSSLVPLFYTKGIKLIDSHENFINDSLNYAYINKLERGISFNIVGKKKFVSMGFLNDNEVENIYFVDGEEIVKQKSTIKRGIAGAIIAGPVGAVLGGLSGLGEIKQQEAYMAIKTDEAKIIFKCKAGTKEIFEKEFKKIFGSKVITTEDLKLQKEQELINNI